MKRTAVVLVLSCLVASLPAAAQRRPAGTAPAEQKVRVAIDLRVNGAPYVFNGQSVCEHLAKGSIYDTMAERWSVRHEAEGRNLNLTLWHPLNGSADMVTLSLASDGKTHDVNTVPAPGGAGKAGSGTVRLTPAGSGGTLTVDAVASSGAKINGTIRCDAFTVPEVVAGD